MIRQKVDFRGAKVCFTGGKIQNFVRASRNFFFRFARDIWPPPEPKSCGRPWLNLPICYVQFTQHLHLKVYLLRSVCAQTALLRRCLIEKKFVAVKVINTALLDIDSRFWFVILSHQFGYEFSYLIRKYLCMNFWLKTIQLYRQIRL